jgi:hypothetical protein
MFGEIVVFRATTLMICIAAWPAPSVAQFVASDDAATPGGAAVFSPTTEQVQNGGLGVRVLFTGRNAQDGVLTVSSEIQNLTDEPIFLGVVGPEPGAIDTNGVSYKFVSVAGIGRCAQLTANHAGDCFTNRSSWMPAASFTTLSPGAALIASLTFSGQTSGSAGMLSVTMNVAAASGSLPGDNDQSRAAALQNIAISFPLIAMESTQ